MSVNDVLHTLIDLASGYKPSLSPDEAAALHESLAEPEAAPEPEPEPEPAPPSSVVPPVGGTETAPPAGW